MQILNTKFALKLFSYTNTDKHGKTGTTSTLKIHFYVLCAKHIYILKNFLTPAHLSVVDLLYTYTEFTFSKTGAFTFLVVYVCKI